MLRRRRRRTDEEDDQVKPPKEKKKRGRLRDAIKSIGRFFLSSVATAFVAQYGWVLLLVAVGIAVVSFRQCGVQ